jgi:transcriptional regulator with PAS, ATPase and Fis domain
MTTENNKLYCIIHKFIYAVCMTKILFTWIGKTDLQSADAQGRNGLGPIAQAAEALAFSHIVLLSDHSQEQTRMFYEWLAARSKAKVDVRPVSISGPTHFGDIYERAREVVTEFIEDKVKSALTFHISPGTPVMAAVWVILAKTRFNATLIESSLQHGVKTVSVPLDISADYIADLLQQPDEQLTKELSLPSTSSSVIIFRSSNMQRVLERAHKVSLRNVPVLIQGESGTGKELVAREIHGTSLRKGKAFVSVNCGAIPDQLAESLLFGHHAGAFTGADRNHVGYIEAANGGTLFLDEIGELPLQLQVKLLRALQENEIHPIGETKTRKVDVRVIAATNKNLLEEVEAGRFREDLYFRLAVAVLELPPIRKREGDVTLLTDHFLEQINRDFAEGQPGYRAKKISAAALNVLKRHPWPGNVRELENTLKRAAVWTEGITIAETDIQDAILSLPRKHDVDGVLGRPLGDTFNLERVLQEVEKHYLERALQEAGGNKTKAAAIVGFDNYQTFSNRLGKVREVKD